MRSSTWISPPFGGGEFSHSELLWWLTGIGVLNSELRKGQEDNTGERQYTFTEADKRKFLEDPDYLLQFRKKIEAEINSLFGMYQQDSKTSNEFREVIRKEMNRRIGPSNEELKKMIIPTWSPGCRGSLHRLGLKMWNLGRNFMFYCSFRQISGLRLGMK